DPLGHATAIERPVRSQPRLAVITALRAERSITTTCTFTVRTPASSMRSVTRGGRPGAAVLGTLSSLMRGRRAEAARVIRPYPLPPASGAEGACTPPGFCAAASAGASPQASAHVVRAAAT